MSGPHTLAIVSAATHHRWEGRLWSHAPYVRELNLWAELFPAVVIVGPVVSSEPPGDHVPFAGDNVTAVGVPPTGGDGLGPKLRQILLLPILLWRMCWAIGRADAIHVRCPGNMGLLGVLVAPALRRPLVAKYAGQWNGFPGEKWTVRLQRALLRSRWWRGPVTVYGEWPDQPPHVVPFFTSVLTQAQIARATSAVERDRTWGRITVLFVGRLSGPKNVATVLRALAQIRAAGIDVTCTIVGDGGERENLEDLAAALSILDVVEFVGAIDVDEVVEFYERSDTLVLVSESEGWPKAIAEAMTFGLVCVGSDRGMVPQMLGEGRGLVAPPGDVEGLAAALHRIATHPAEADEMGRRAARWGSRHSLEELQDAIARLLTDRWGVPVGTGPRRVSVMHVTDTLAAGGAERVAVNLVNGLPTERFEPIMCTTRRDGELSGEIADHVTRLALGRTHRVTDAVALWRLARHLRRHRIDLVHAHATSLFIASAACRLAPRTRLVWHDHLGASIESRRRRRVLYRRAAARVDHIVTVSALLEDWAVRELHVPAERVTTIPNFVLAEPLRTDGPPPLLPGQPGRRIACVANLRDQKDHLMLIRAMSLVIEMVADAHLLIIGAPIDPGLEQRIGAAVESLGLGANVTLLGSRRNVATLLGECDIGVLASRSEGFPLALLEYGRAGLGVAATDVGECGEILDHGTAGLLVPSGDASAMAAALCHLLSDPEERAALGTRLRRRVEQRYRAGEVVERIEDIYRRVLAGED